MKIFIISIFILLFTVNVYAQPNRDKIKALKVSFITERLDLSAKEAEKFWPVYNAYDDATLKIKHQDMRAIKREIRQNLETLSDDKADALLNSLVEAENKLHNEKIQLVSKLKKIISPQKIILLRAAEDDFNRKLFEQLRSKRRGKD